MEFLLGMRFQNLEPLLTLQTSTGHKNKLKKVFMMLAYCIRKSKSYWTVNNCAANLMERSLATALSSFSLVTNPPITSLVLSYFLKNASYLVWEAVLRIRDVYPGSGSRGQIGTGSRIRIRNTAGKLNFFNKNIILLVYLLYQLMIESIKKLYQLINESIQKLPLDIPEWSLHILKIVERLIPLLSHTIPFDLHKDRVPLFLLQTIKGSIVIRVRWIRNKRFWHGSESVMPKQLLHTITITPLKKNMLMFFSLLSL
jgi:hypothetical protein